MKLKNDYRDKAVLVTGGTRGIGLATGLAFAREGAHVYLTHKWGSADEDELKRRFAEGGAARAPTILEADAAVEEDCARVFAEIKREHDRLEVLVSNVAFAQVVGGLESYVKRSLMTSLGYSAWPLVMYFLECERALGRFPRYVIGSSCDGPDTYYPGYDFVACAKVVMEVLCRYLTAHLFGQDVRINILRSRPVPTESLVATFGAEFQPFLEKYFGRDYLIEPGEVAAATLALCSGWLDAVSGQVLLLDRGVAFCDNLMRLYQDRDRYGL
jgi:NAD(P)-dependent dehydrogenase (short-subunit alcohol dehydrogenase family)